MDSGYTITKTPFRDEEHGSGTRKGLYGDDSEGGYEARGDLGGGGARGWKVSADSDDREGLASHGQGKGSAYVADTTAEEAEYKKSSGAYGEDAERTSGDRSRKVDDGEVEEEESGYGTKKLSGYGSKKNNVEEEENGYGVVQRKSSGHGSAKKLDSHGDVVPDDFEKSQFNREDVEDLKKRTDIDDDAREHRRKVLLGEVAAGVVGAGVLGVAGYAAYKHFTKNDDEEPKGEEEGEERKSAFVGRKKNKYDEGYTKETNYGEEEDVDESSGYGKKKTVSFGQDEDESIAAYENKTGYGEDGANDESSGYGTKERSDGEGMARGRNAPVGH